MDIFTKCRNFTTAKEAREAGLYPYFRVIKNAEGGTVFIDGQRKVMAGSNNYLSLTSHPKVLAAAKKAVDQYGTGCSGSRFLNGTIALHIELEKRLAHFMQKESALVYSTGFQTNLGTISCLVGPKDVIFSDSENHASIIEGTHLAEGPTVVFKHNDMADLERLLKEHKTASGKLIVTDGVFSMTGDIARVDEIVKLAKKYEARVMVDDAHGIGVLGKLGRGTADHFKATKDVDIIMGTFSKSFASLGGFIVASEEVIEYVKHHARSFIFSASMPPSAIAAVIAALDVMETEPEHIERLWANTRKMKKGFDELGYDTSPSQTPIIPINIGDDLRTLFFAKAIYDEGVFTNPVLPPGVPKDQSLIRTSFMANHTEKELNIILDVFERVGKTCELIH
ncbi:MAG: pyridoxal phosphate-dependent aminotransferase family protein [Deltaproteobacteria bacterium]|nr:pyridoxal phosphate-dependent aminotransferase family protein [Deltaproteobacteria bacterium]MBI3016517.1 pyridoxal phosphate-dependent aminotransferase family protein [Deltaproteobacteria bacterium]